MYVLYFYDFFSLFMSSKGWLFLVNHEISSLICPKLKKYLLYMSSAANLIGASSVNMSHCIFMIHYFEYYANIILISQKCMLDVLYRYDHDF